MSWSQDTGYTPATIEVILESLMDELNDVFELDPPYTVETFAGTNYYKFLYLAAQRLQENEVKTSEILLKLQEYFDITNESIQRPVATNPGLIEALEREGYTASVKPTIDADAGKVYICLDLDDGDADYATDKAAVAEIIKDSVAAGIVSQGTESTAIVLSNGQSFDFKFNLPDLVGSGDPLLRLTLTLSENNQVVVGDPDEVKALLVANIAARYKLGKNFEPQRYFSQSDAPWTSQVLLEYSLNGGGAWASTVYNADYDEKFDIKLANVSLVEV